MSSLTEEAFRILKSRRARSKSRTMEASSQTLFKVIVTLSHAWDLAPMGRGDVYVTFQIGDQLQKSSCQCNKHDTKWTPREQFLFTVSDIQHEELSVLVCNSFLQSSTVMTDSVVARNDLYGWLTLPLRDFLDHNDTKNPNEIKPFLLNLPKCNLRYRLASELYLSIEIVEEAVDWQDGTVRVVWENEVLVPEAGWTPSQGNCISSPGHFSSEDGRISSEYFHCVAPNMPAGFECDGWARAENEGDSDGWFYAPLFIGPWFEEPFDLASARRRKWVNTYRRVKCQG